MKTADSVVIGPRLIDSPFLGAIPTERLSGGVKTLMLMNFDSEHICYRKNRADTTDRRA